MPPQLNQCVKVNHDMYMREFSLMYKQVNELKETYVVTFRLIISFHLTTLTSLNAVELKKNPSFTPLIG